MRSAKGATLIEISIVMVVAILLLLFAAPAFTKMLDSHRLKTAAETMYLRMVYAKSEAIKRNTSVRMTFKVGNSGMKWCYGLKEKSKCDCEVANSCVLGAIDRSFSADSSASIRLEPRISSPGDHFTFGSTGWVMDGTFGHVRLYSPQGRQIRVIVSKNARIRFCSPAGDSYVTGYSTSC